MDVEDLKSLLEIAKRAARLAAAVHFQARSNGFGIQTKQSSLDLVTTVDRESEAVLTDTILKARPDDSIIGEEGTNITGDSGVTWVLDPLDGTSNFVHGYPAHAVAIGIEIDGLRSLGVVHDTARDAVYSGITGVGASCDDQSISAGSRKSPGEALIGTGFLPVLDVRKSQAQVLSALLPQIGDLRRSGCPSLDLCAVATGALDGYYEAGLGRWDIAAGAAIAESAGAVVVEFKSALLPNPVVIAANPLLFDALVSALRGIGAI